MTMDSTPPIPSPPLPPPRPRRRRWRNWLLALLIFIGGIAFGSGLTVIVAIRAVRHAIQHPEQAPARITARLRRYLDLTPDQASRVQSLIATRQQALQQVRREIEPRVRIQLGELESEIGQVLTPPQRTKWDRLRAQLRQNWLPPGLDWTDEPHSPPATTESP